VGDSASSSRQAVATSVRKQVGGFVRVVFYLTHEDLTDLLRKQGLLLTGWVSRTYCRSIRVTWSGK
jgi:hypothetical protein